MSSLLPLSVRRPHSQILRAVRNVTTRLSRSANALELRSLRASYIIRAKLVRTMSALGKHRTGSYVRLCQPSKREHEYSLGTHRRVGVPYSTPDMIICDRQDSYHAWWSWHGLLNRYLQALRQQGARRRWTRAAKAVLRGYSESRCELLNNRDSLALEWMLIRQPCYEPAALSVQPLIGHDGSASG